MICALLFIVLLKRENKSIKEYLKIHKVNFKIILVLILIAFILVAFNLTLATILTKYIPNNSTSETELYFWSILHLAILAPICEEIFFRGILFQKLKEIMPLFLSVIIQGFIFGFLNSGYYRNIVHSIVAGLSGILYALLYNYKKT